MHHLPETLEFETKTSEDSKSNPDFATNINGGHWVSMLQISGEVFLAFFHLVSTAPLPQLQVT